MTTSKILILLMGISQGAGIANAVVDLNGVVLRTTGWQDLCMGFHPVNVESSRGLKV